MLPASVFGTVICNTVVQAARTALPEFDLIGHYPVATPERRAWHFFPFEFFFKKHEALLQLRSGGHDLALQGGPSTYLALSGTRIEIGIRGFWGDLLHFAEYTHLTLKLGPKEIQAYSFVCRQFPSLSAGVIGEEYESFTIQITKQYDTGIRRPSFAGSGQGHGIRLLHLRINGMAHPLFELPERVTIHMGFVQLERGVVGAKVAYGSSYGWHQ